MEKEEEEDGNAAWPFGKLRQNRVKDM
jgi:hypothetical protein